MLKNLTPGVKDTFETQPRTEQSINGQQTRENLKIWQPVANLKKILRW